MSDVIGDLLSLGVILYMMAVLVAAVVGVPAAIIALTGRMVGIW